MCQMTHSVQLTLFPPSYFDRKLVTGNADKITLAIPFSDSKLLLVDLKFDVHTKYLSKKQNFLNTT